jgi:hypothetical protein
MISQRLNHYSEFFKNYLWRTRRAFLGEKRTALLITQRNRISASQIYPYYYYRKDLLDRLRFDFDQISLDEFERGTYKAETKLEVIVLQPWWNISPVRLIDVLAKIKGDFPGATVVFLDSFAPLDLRLAQHLGDSVDWYVKKQLFRDRGCYGVPTLGDTNLSSYYAKLYGLEYPEVLFPIPKGFRDKLVIGPGFVTSDFLLPAFAQPARPPAGPRRIDLHARLGGGGEGWYGQMRDHARLAVGQLRNITVVSGGVVEHRAYMNEMRESKACFSPFGYGEVCWRDYEAVVSGALLVKPDMGHIESYPDIFKAYETYVPIKWDFSDLDEKIRYYLARDDERNEIVQRAFDAVANYFQSGGFLKHVSAISEKQREQRERPIAA